MSRLASGLRPIPLKKPGSTSACRQHIHGVPRYRRRWIHNCHFAFSVQKINLVVTSCQVRPPQQQPRGSRNHMCHKTNYLLLQIAFQFHCPLRVLSAVIKTPELHGTHVRKPTWLFHTTFWSTLSWDVTTWAVTHCKNFCVRVVAFVCLFMF